MLPVIALIVILTSCAGSPTPNSSQPQRGEYVTRKHTEFAYTPLPSEPLPPPVYPWDKPMVGNHPPLTKEHFRCKGSSLNPVRILHDNSETVRLYDCGGSEKHSLPLRDGKEFIYPILLEVLNYVQAQTGKKVVITCGHRCPEHNAYSDPSKENQHSKHMVGAEVSFYVQGMENNPEKVIALIQEFYKKKHNSTQYTKFERYTKGDTNVAVAPWFNKEIFIKLFGKNEGRNFDNRHPYPYISLQVRCDEVQGRVIYDWNLANKNYLRK